MAHARAKHNENGEARAPQRFFSFPDGECRSCGTKFHTRLRLMKHLCRDLGSNKCWTHLSRPAQDVKPLSVDEVADLDEADKIERRDARASGHTAPRAKGVALTKSGKRIGGARW